MFLIENTLQYQLTLIFPPSPDTEIIVSKLKKLNKSHILKSVQILPTA